jgi:sulfatase maturation enzyme AslB (radical SAM superfamily)
MTDLFATYDEQRDFSQKTIKAACYAPFHHLDFLPNGDAWVCCVNGTYTVGNVEKETVREIWNGPRIQHLRESLVRNDWSLGCQDCQNSILRGGLAKAMRYDWATIDDWEWPQSFSLRLSNACNFGCIMCTDQLSSVVRSRSRSSRLPVVYGDRFFAELEEFLPHLKLIHFAGGEPCIIPEYFRIWEMLGRSDYGDVELSLVTNASAWNEKVAESIEKLNFTNILVSIDGATKETFEKVRLGSDFDVVMENLHRFAAAAARVRQRGRHVGPATLAISYCLMPVNYHEMADVMLLAEEFGAEVSISVVLDPVSCSFLDLHPREIYQAYDALLGRLESVETQLSVSNRRGYLEAAEEIRGMAREVEEGLRAPGERHPWPGPGSSSSDILPISHQGDSVHVAILSAPSESRGRGCPRTSAIARSLARSGVRVTLLHFGPERTGPVVSERDAITVRFFDRTDLEQSPRVEATITETGAQAVVAVSIDAVLASAHACGRLPLWIDLAENPLSTSSNSTLTEVHDSLAVRDWWRLAPALDRGTRFSCDSEEQRLVLLALLGLRGRLGENPDCSIVGVLNGAEGIRPETTKDLCDWARGLARVSDQ